MRGEEGRDSYPRGWHSQLVDLYQECAAQHHFAMVEVPSSDGVTSYTVVINPEGEAICHCPSYAHRGYCRHTALAVTKVCHWSEVDSNYIQTTLQRRHHECPVCGGPTQLVAA